MVFLLWVCGVDASAEPPVPPDTEPADHEPADDAPIDHGASGITPDGTLGVPSPDPEHLLHLARERLRHGDFEGVRIVADQALQIEGDHQRTAQYLIAISHEYGGQPALALEIYDALKSAYPEREIPEDLRFRRAECLGRLRRYEDARDELAALPQTDRPPLDQLKIDVLTGLWDLALGRKRRALRRLSGALDGVEPSVGSYYQALARSALLEQALDTAEQIQFVGSDAAKKRALQKRAALIEAGNEQLAEIIRTEEVSFALEGFLSLGRAHESIARALLGESPIRGLTEEQLAINRDLLRKEVDGIFVKATLYYDRALDLAAKMDWTSEPVPTIRSVNDALVAEMDAAGGR